MRSSPLLATVLLAACASAHGPSAEAPDAAEPSDAAAVVADLALVPDLATARLPILFIHGINGAATDFDAMIDRFVAAGWPRELLFARTFKDPKWGCNVDNAATIAGWADELRTATGAPAIDLVAHSMGTLSSRYYVKTLGGTAKVRTYVTLGGMHHGLASSCSPDFPFKPCVWSELCASGPYVAALNAAPVTPGPTKWVSIHGTGDTTVPNDSSMLVGAENVSIPGATHMGLIAEEPGFDAVRSRL